MAQLCAGFEHVAWLHVGLGCGCDCMRCEVWGHTRTTMEVCSALARKQCSAVDEGEATSGSSVCVHGLGVRCVP